MSKSMTTTKIAGGVLGALLVFLLGNWAAKSFYSTATEGHGEEAAVRGYVVLPEEGAGDAGAEAEPEVSLAELLAAADAGKGEKLFAKCKACHKLEDGANGVGPSLFGVYGRDIASAEGFAFSDALSGLEGSWDAEALDAWLENPKAYAPGNKMSFKGLPKETDRANMIAYLATIGGDGLDLNALEGAAAPAEAPAAMQEEPATETAEAPAAEPAPATETAEAPAAEETPAAEPTQPPAAEQATAEEPAPATPETQTAEAPAEEPASTEAAQTAPPAEPAAEPAVEETAMAGDVEAGAKVFKKCKACHAVEAGTNKVGPSLFGIFGREVATVEGFNYSGAMEALGGSWTAERLDEFLTKPKDMVPGTKMSFSGLRKEADRLNVIAYLESLK